MTTVLHRVASGSSVGRVEFEDNASVTNPLDLADLIGWYVDYEHPHGAEVYSHARTTIESDVFDLEPRGSGLEASAEEQRRVGGDFRNMVFRVYHAGVTDWSQESEVYFRDVLRVVTSVSYDSRDELVFESGSAAAGEDIPGMLQEALDALAEVKSVAREEDCNEPSDLAISNAEVVVRMMFELSDRAYDVYPMGGGEIAIDVGNAGRRIGVFCYPDGKMQYVVFLDDEPQDVRKDSVEDIPIDLLSGALHQLDT